MLRKVQQGFFTSSSRFLQNRAAAAPFCGFHTSVPVERKITVDELAETTNLKGKRVLVRADLNVPLNKKETGPKITDDTRIRGSLPTVELLVNKGAKVILCSHLGRPDGKVTDSLRLDPVGAHLSKLLGKPVTKLNDCIGDEVKEAVSKMQDGDVVLLENVRFYAGEEDNDAEFAAALASNADIFVNDAFGTAHRAHASTEGVTKHLEHSVAGFLMEKELKYLGGVLEEPKRPLAAIIGGGKVSTKLPILENLLKRVDKLLIGGGMIFTIYRAMGYNTGKSLVDEKLIEKAKDLLKKAEERGVKIVLPVDIVVAESYTPEASHKVVPANEIPENWIGMDIGPETVRKFKRELTDCKTIVWNGPMGVFEFEKFAVGTTDVAVILSELTKRGATSIIGGGDSIAAVEDSGVAENITHISTGGGASLEMLEGKDLPGVVALDEAK